MNKVDFFKIIEEDKQYYSNLLDTPHQRAGVYVITCIEYLTPSTHEEILHYLRYMSDREMSLTNIHNYDEQYLWYKYAELLK